MRGVIQFRQSWIWVVHRDGRRDADDSDSSEIRLDDFRFLPLDGVVGSWYYPLLLLFAFLVREECLDDCHSPVACARAQVVMVMVSFPKPRRMTMMTGGPPFLVGHSPNLAPDRHSVELEVPKRCSPW